MIRIQMIRTRTASLLLAVATTLVAAGAASVQTESTEPGKQSSWSLDFSARMEQHSSRPIEVHMIGDWTSTISAVRAGEYDAQLQLTHIRFAGNGVKGAPSGSLTALETRLTRPFWATYRSDGGLISMHFLRDATPSDRNLLQMIATELQIVRPGSARESWTAQERDGAGEYSALYLSPQPDRILKRKLKYVYTDGVAGAPSDAVRISIEQSDVVFSMTPNHLVQAVDGTNRVRMSLSPDKSEQLEAVTEFHASHLQTSSAPALVGSLERALPNVVDSPVVTQRPDASVARAEADDRLLNGYTTEAMLTAAFSKGPGPAGQAAAADRLTALFRRRPQSAEDAEDLLVQNGPRKTVTNALGAAGSVSAVAALSKLAHNATLAENLRVDAILAFVQTQHPTVEAMHVTDDLTADKSQAVRSAASLISGALSRAGRADHPAEADAIDTGLLALYRSAQDTREKTDLLGALGNSAGPAATKAIEESMSDPSGLVRAAAARALRLAPGPGVDRYLAAAMVKDNDPAVRADAIFATRFRNPLPAELTFALQQAASADPVKYVRSDALAVLSQNLTASPRIAETLAGIAESDVDPGVNCNFPVE